MLMETSTATTPLERNLYSMFTLLDPVMLLIGIKSENILNYRKIFSHKDVYPKIILWMRELRFEEAESLP